MNAAPTRLTDIELPRERFVPGLTPRPAGDWLPQVDPRGFTASDWRACEAYCYGVDLYNAWLWWEAHEAMEGVWMRARGRPIERAFVQAVIMSAAAALKVEAGRVDGAARLLGKASARLDLVASERGLSPVGGIDAGAWLRALSAYYEPLIRGGEMVHDADRFPYLRPGAL